MTQPAATAQEPLSITVTRVLPAAPATVFAAWTDAENLKSWFFPGDVSIPEVRIDARVGGRFFIAMRGNESGKNFDHQGEYLELDPPRRLVFTWEALHMDAPDSLITIELEPVDGGTKLSLTHARIHDPGFAESYREGWGKILEAQAAALAGATA